MFTDFLNNNLYKYNDICSEFKKAIIRFCTNNSPCIEDNRPSLRRFMI